MKNRLEKLKSNRGFTLVECVVSIGLFAIMSLMLMMIMSMTIKIRQHNMEVEAGIDEQVENIAVSDSTLQKTTFSGTIDFGTAGSISPDGTYVKANKVYTDGADMQVGALAYDFSAYATKVVDDEGGESGYGADRVYGAAQIDATNGVIVSASAPALSSGKYTITWKVEYNLTAVNSSESLKLVLPDGALLTGTPTTTGGVAVMLITDRAVKLSSTYTGSKIAQFSFTMSESDFNSNYKSFVNYMKNKLAPTDTLITCTPITFKRNADGEFAY